MPSRALLTVPLALAAATALAAPSTAQAPPTAHAEARVTAGDLGTITRAIADGDAERRATGAAKEDGLEIAAGTATARSSLAGGRGSARAVARADRVVLLGGLVSAARVDRSATAAGGDVLYDGSVRALVIAGQPIGDVVDPAVYPFDGGTVTVNTQGAGLEVVLAADRDGFAAGTTVTVASVFAHATDGPEPTPTPAATPEPTPEPTPDARTGDNRDRAGHREPDAGGAADRPARRRRPDPAKRLASGAFVFPVYGDARIADDFGAFRQIGDHQGNDVFAPFGAPVLAVADGTVERVGTLPISGNRLWLRTERGDAFFYAHLSAFAPDAVDGREVEAGTLLGFTGNTGDAEPTPPHVHFEIHPGGPARKAIDPHAVLTAWQADGIAPSGGWLARYGDDTAARPGALVEVRDFIAGE